MDFKGGDTPMGRTRDDGGRRDAGSVDEKKPSRYTKVKDERMIYEEVVRGTEGKRVPTKRYTVKVKVERVDPRTGEKKRVTTMIAAGTSLANARLIRDNVLDEEVKRRHGIALPPKPRMMFAQWTRAFMQWRETEGNQTLSRDLWCIKQLEQEFGRLRLDEITRPKVMSYMERLKREGGITPATINRRIALLRKCLNHAVEMEELDANRMAGTKLLKEATPRKPSLSTDEEARLLEALKTPWHRLMVKLALATGAREGELLSLRWRQVRFEEGVIQIPTSKSGKPRKIPLHKGILEELRTLRSTDGALVMGEADGRPHSKHSVGQWFARAAEKAKLTVSLGGDRPGKDGSIEPERVSRFRFHDLRHVAAQRLVAAGVSSLVLADILGHADLKTTRRYVTEDAEAMLEAVNRSHARMQAIAADEARRRTGDVVEFRAKPESLGTE